jgi:hypothetical protein
LNPVFFKAKHTSLLTVLLLFILVNVCDGFSTLHHQPHQVKHFSRPQFRFPKVAPYSPSPSGINTVNGRRMATSISNEEGHQGRRDENKIRHNIKTWSSDFWFGFTHVHNHYLELCWGYTRVIALTCLPVILYFVVGIALFPSTTAQTSLALVRVLSMIGALAHKTLFFPPLIILRCLSFLATVTHLAAWAIKNKKNPIQVLWVFLRKLAKGEIGLDRTIVMEPYFNMPIVRILIFAPVLEEILCRYLFDRVWHGSAHWINRLNKRHSSKSAHGSQETKIESADMMANELSIPQRLWFGHKPWVLISSLVFAAAHLNNRSSFIASFDPEMVKSDPHLYMNKRNLISISWALRQAVGAGFISLRVLSPVYLQRGLLASIAAHFAWNLGIMVSFLQLEARLFVRAIKSIRNWVRPHHEKPSQ